MNGAIGAWIDAAHHELPFGHKGAIQIMVRSVNSFPCRGGSAFPLRGGLLEDASMDLEFRKFTDFDRGLIYDILKDAYSFDARYAGSWEDNWRQSDGFFFDNPQIAEKYGFVTCWQGQPIGFITWDPRHRPEYVEIGHNGIRAAFKGRGFGKAQLEEALRRIREYAGLKEIRVCSNGNLIAPRNYESAGFVLYDRKENRDTPFSGDYLYYRIRLQEEI